MCTRFAGQTSVSQQKLIRLSWASWLPVGNTFKFLVYMRVKITYNVNIAQFVQPEVIYRGSRHHKVAIGQLGIDCAGCQVELVENPPFNEALHSRGLHQIINLS
jgi:hypothetical protein